MTQKLHYVNQPLSRLILMCMVLVAVLPMLLLCQPLYQQVKAYVQQDATDRHLLLARSLAEPVHYYVSSHQQTLLLLAGTLEQFASNVDTLNTQTLLDRTIKNTEGFIAITLLSTNARSKSYASHKIQPLINLPNYSQQAEIKKTIELKAPQVSPVIKSIITHKPTIILTQPVLNQDGSIFQVLVAELNLEPIEIFRSRIRFSEHGHSAIVDQRGKVIAHENGAWVDEIKDISGVSVVQKVLKGESGITEFYSPLMKQQMIAGFVTVPELGWGIIVPQPIDEMVSNINGTLTSLLLWSLLGVLIAISLGWLLVRWITQPLKQLAKQASVLETDLHEEKKVFDFAHTINKAPLEILQVANATQSLVQELQHSNQQVNLLNRSLKERVNRATSELRNANAQLQQLASSDHLTTIANRRYFEDTVSDMLNRDQGKSIGIMLVDIDNFKQINDQYGHAAGDFVLTTVASQLRKTTRTGDIIARYGGDEFVAQLETDLHTLSRRAEQLRKLVEQHPFAWNDQLLQITLSIGITTHITNSNSNLDHLMSQADAAMYQAKKAGRNQVVLLSEPEDEKVQFPLFEQG